MNCPAVTSQHDGRDVKVYVSPITGSRHTYCAGCYKVAVQMGLPLITVVENETRRRRFPARDLTGWITPGPSAA